MKVHFHTNLDKPASYVREMNDVWPMGGLLSDRYVPIPEVGDHIEFEVHGSEHRRTFMLEVIGRTWIKRTGFDVSLQVELHIPRHMNQSVAEWEAYYRRHVENRAA